MKKFLAATAIVAMTFSITTPAWADDEDENYDDVVLSPVTLEGDYTPQQICDEALKPNPHSGFTTEPLVSTDTGWLNDGSPVRDENVGNAIPTGTPTSSFLILDGGYFRNGGSPNVWGHGTATLNDFVVPDPRRRIFPQWRQPQRLGSRHGDAELSEQHAGIYDGPEPRPYADRQLPCLQVGGPELTQGPAHGRARWTADHRQRRGRS